MSNSEQVEVDFKALINLAMTWDMQGISMGSNAAAAKSLMYTGFAGISGTIVLPYNEVCLEVAMWCSEGKTAMESIGSALITAAKNYQDTEDKNTSLSTSVQTG